MTGDGDDPGPADRDNRARLRLVPPAEPGSSEAQAGPIGDRGSGVDIVRDGPQNLGDAGRASGPGASSVMVDHRSADDRAGENDDGHAEQDWAWVAEWRASDEPPPWSTGLVLSAFAAVLAGVAIWVLSAGLADRPVLAVVLNLLVAGGLVPAMWLSRNLPVLRWFAGGAAVGVVGGWLAALMML